MSKRRLTLTSPDRTPPTGPPIPCNSHPDSTHQSPTRSLTIPGGERARIRRLLADGYNDQLRLGDHRVAGLPTPTVSLTEAAVLVGLVNRGDGIHILLTRRSEHLNHHAGQVSFPGGRTDPGDQNPTATALREAHEEIGLRPDNVEVLGQLNRYQTGTGFLITPIVAAVAADQFNPDPNEVAELFELPMAIALQRPNYRRGSYRRNGQRRSFYRLPYQNYDIWGATAAILVSLCDTLQADERRE